jgi:hypothetical protein
MYKCYYCGIKESSFQSITEHCKLSHGEETLKYRQLILDENTGIQRYQTKIHEGVVPSNLTKYDKCITVSNGLAYILDKESKRKKLNTPVRENFCKNLFQTPKSNQIKLITKLPNSEQSYKGKVKTHKYITRQNQSTTGKL